MTIVSKMQCKQLLHKCKDLAKSGNFLRCQLTHAAMRPAHHNLRNVESEQCNEIRPFDEIPGPKPLPIVGNTFRFIPYVGEFSNTPAVSMMHLLRARYGEIVKLDGILGRSTNVILFNAEEAEKLYRQEGPWPMRVAMETMKQYRLENSERFNGNLGLVISQGKMWHDFRKNVNQHMMQPRAIKPFVSQVDQVSSEFVEKMRKLRNATTLKLPPTFNNEMNKWALESICVIALDHRMGCLDTTLAEHSDPQRMINAVHDMFDLFYKLEIMPSLWKYYRTPDLIKLFRTFDTIIDISSKHIDHAKERFRSNPNKNEQDRSLVENLFLIDKQTALIMALDMLTAGIDTTSNATGFFFYYMATNPKTQEKLRKEVIRRLPEKDSPMTYEILNDIPYLKACLKETLRLSPIAIGNLRTTVKDIVLSGYKIPSGIGVIACHSVLSQDANHFPEPEKFIAERWLRENRGPTSAKEAHPFAYMPFGFGPRTCIGRRFAELEMETLILRVLRNFRLEWEGAPLKTKDGFIRTVASPLEFKLTEL